MHAQNTLRFERCATEHQYREGCRGSPEPGLNGEPVAGPAKPCRAAAVENLRNLDPKLL
jgi:hypothetical protein